MEDNFILKNVYEDMVGMYIDDCIAESNMCLCPRCRADVYALTLNNMPPKYVVADGEYLFARAQALSAQYKIDIIAAITKSIMIVAKEPRHNTYSFSPK